LLYSKNLDSIQFIDIRNAHDFSISHLPNAINIPMKNFLNKKYYSKIDKNKVLMVYGYNSSEPRMISLLSAHYKIANLYVILGGYDYLKKNILDNFGIYSGVYNDEDPLCDFAKKMTDVASKAGAPAKSSKAPKAAPAPMVKRKKKEVSGGCG
jgi:rhodanese-related sulfurtransferase